MDLPATVVCKQFQWTNRSNSRFRDNHIETERFQARPQSRITPAEIRRAKRSRIFGLSTSGPTAAEISKTSRFNLQWVTGYHGTESQRENRSLLAWLAGNDSTGAGLCSRKEVLVPYDARRWPSDYADAKSMTNTSADA